MRQDQIARLQKLSEKLADVVLEEADPDTWPGAGVPLADVSQAQRGDRYWCKKNAAATFALLERAHSLLTDAKDIAPNGKPFERPDLDQDIADAEKRAAKAVSKAVAKAQERAKRTTRANGG